MTEKNKVDRPNVTTSKLLFGFVLVAIGSVILLSGIRGLLDNRQKLVTPGGVILIEKAVTKEERRIGLSNRQKLEKDAGMLFVFDGDLDIHCFWMKDTFIPLDMVWLDKDKKVVFVHENAEVKSEKSICPDKGASYVLEVNAGQADKLGLDIGVTVKF